jgi:hypothetical protein
VSISTTSQRTRVFADSAPTRPAHEWRWMRLVVWAAILTACAAFWVGVGAVLLAL